MRFLVLVFLAGCGTVVSKPLCVTKCGLRYQGQYQSRASDYQCSDLQRTEDLIMPELPTGTCQRLPNWDLWTNPNEAWVDAWQRKIAGATNCRTWIVEIGSAGNISKSALAHELVHVGQECNSPPPNDPGVDSDHSDWVRNGWFALVDRVNAQ